MTVKKGRKGPLAMVVTLLGLRAPAAALWRAFSFSQDTFRVIITIPIY